MQGFIWILTPNDESTITNSQEYHKPDKKLKIESDTNHVVHDLKPWQRPHFRGRSQVCYSTSSAPHPSSWSMCSKSRITIKVFSLTWGTGFVHDRFRVIFPPPQVTGTMIPSWFSRWQGVAMVDQGDQPPSMVMVRWAETQPRHTNTSKGKRPSADIVSSYN